MSVRGRAVLGLWVALLGFVVGCGGAGGVSRVELALILPLTSGVAEAAASAQRGAQLAVEEVNAEGRIRLDLGVGDDRGSQERAGVLFAEAAAKPRLAAVIGGFTDTVAIALSPLAARAQVPLVSPGATGEIPYAGSFFFRTALPAAVQGRALAAFAVRAGLRRVSVMYDSNEYGTAVALAFTSAFTGLNGTVTGQRLFRDETQDFGRFLRGAREENAQAVLFAGYPDEGRVFLTQLVQAGLRLPVLAPDALASPEVVRGLGKAAEGLVVASAFFPESSLPAVRAFVRAYRTKYGVDPDAFAAQAYDAVKIVVFALRRTRLPTTGPLDRIGIRDAIAGIQDYPGVTGTIRFDRFGTVVREALVLRVEGSRFGIAR